MLISWTDLRMIIVYYSSSDNAADFMFLINMAQSHCMIFSLWFWCQCPQWTNFMDSSHWQSILHGDFRALVHCQGMGWHLFHGRRVAELVEMFLKHIMKWKVIWVKQCHEPAPWPKSSPIFKVVCLPFPNGGFMILFYRFTHIKWSSGFKFWPLQSSRSSQSSLLIKPFGSIFRHPNNHCWFVLSSIPIHEKVD